MESPASSVVSLPLSKRAVVEVRYQDTMKNNSRGDIGENSLLLAQQTSTLAVSRLLF